MNFIPRILHSVWQMILKYFLKYELIFLLCHYHFLSSYFYLTPELMHQPPDYSFCFQFLSVSNPSSILLLVFLLQNSNLITPKKISFKKKKKLIIVFQIPKHVIQSDSKLCFQLRLFHLMYHTLFILVY